MQVQAIFVGVDASKVELVCNVHGSEVCTLQPNQAAAIVAWLKTLPEGVRIAVESTGDCHAELARRAVGLGIEVYVLNARDVYFYAKALGTRGKTDRVDARVIARYLAEHHARLRPYRLPSPEQAEIEKLLGQRWAAVSKRTALRQALRGTPAIDDQVQQLNASFDSLLQAIDSRIDQLIGADKALQASRQQLLTITGVGSQASALLGSLLSRLKFATADAFVAYSGLDPRPHDSGRSRGKRRLSKRGSPDLRRQMFMAAMSASHSKVFKPLYEQIRARGFKTTEALVILARKLLRIAYAVWSRGTPFDPARFTASA
jgi:transposase